MKKRITIKMIFCGTADFALPTLLKLIENKNEEYDFDIALIITQPDKPKGRNLKTDFSEIKKVAISNDIPLFQPQDVNSEDSIKKITSLKPDMIVTVAYGAFIGKYLRTLCPLGVINLHPSLLPKHRGADPVRSTLLSDDEY